MDLRWISLLLLNHVLASQEDPCTTYQMLNDSSFRMDSITPEDQSSCDLFPPPPWPKWYRFTATQRGEIATQCPQNSSCGAIDQLWINDTLPLHLNGEKSVRTCLKSSTDCCANGGNITVKTCNGYFVYKLMVTPRCSRYCINVVVSQDDPCTTYQMLNDSSFRIDSITPVDQSSCMLLFPPPPRPQWYRFTATPRGEIATQCPRNSSCGAIDQLWINDTLPLHLNGEKSVRTCLKQSTDCCANGGTITVKTCKGYFVYKLAAAQRCSRYCINTTAPTIVSATTGATSTLLTSVSNSTTQISTSKRTTGDSSTVLSSTLKPQIVSTTKIASTKVLIYVSNSKGMTEITSEPTDDTTTASNTLLHSVVDSSHESGYQTSTAVQTVVSNSNSMPVISNSTKTEPTTASQGLDLHKSHLPSENSNNMIAAIIGSVVGLAVIFLVVLLLYRKKCRNQKRRQVKSTYILHNDIPVVKEEGFVEKRKFDAKSIGQQADGTGLAQYNSNEDFH